MYSYNKIVDNLDSYYLPLIDEEEKVYIKSPSKLPLSFYEKYSLLFKESLKFIEEFKNINKEELIENNIKIDSWEESFDLNIEYDNLMEEIPWIEKHIKNINIKSNEIEYIFEDLKKIVLLLSKIYPYDNYIYYKKVKEYDLAIENIIKCQIITYDPSTTKYVKEFLRDQWYILPNGKLYNVGNGHKGTRLIYDYQDVLSGKDLKELPNKYIKIFKRIYDEGFRSIDYKAFINGVNKPMYFDTTHDFPTCHEPHLLNMIIGVVFAKYYFYNFFEELQSVSNDYERDLNKIKELTNNEITDILVRCCGFHKVESQMDKTITTSCINYEEEFKEYIDNGWTIKFINPIIIDKNNKTISEYPDYPLVIKNILRFR